MPDYDLHWTQHWMFVTKVDAKEYFATQNARKWPGFKPALEMAGTKNDRELTCY